jgi:serine/threonine-protein kinase
MGVVYQAHDPQIGRTIALKVLRPDRVSSEDFVQRFLKEARAIGRMSHQNIVTVYDVGQDQSTVYIAMEFLEGEALNAYARDRALTMEQIMDIGIQVADSLDYAHTRGIVHRDIKPQNIMVAPTGVVKLTDFGIAHVEDPEASHQTQAGEILGTPNYMSPEQVMGKKVDGRSDLYSLGVILYELATGSRPFKGENLAAIFHAITSETPARPEALNTEVPKGLSGVILRCLEKNPDERFRTGHELAEALRALCRAGEEVTGAEAGKRKGPLVMILAALAAVCVIAAVVFFMAAGKKEPPVDMGSLRVSSDPAGAQVYVDGSLKGTAPTTVELPVGGHEVRLSMPGHYEWEARVQVDKEGGEPLTVELMPVEE